MNKSRDFVSGLLYCISTALSIPALILLIIFSVKTGNALKVVSSTIYGASLFLLLLFSTLSHWLLLSDFGKRIFRKLNHIFIYIFIFATAMPICLIGIKGAWGWSIFGVILGLAILCIVFNSIWVNYPNILYSCIYFLLGALTLLPLHKLISNLNILDKQNSILYLFFGNILYTISTIIYATNPYKNNVLLKHFFNILVLSGIISHYIFIFRYILAI